MVRRKLLAGIAALSCIVVGAGVTYSATIGQNAGAAEANLYVTGDSGWTTTSSAWVDVPGASRSFVVSSGTTRLLAARFSAESLCAGPSGWCSLRMMLINLDTGASMGELYPRADIDFAFQSAGTASEWEAHSMERVTSRLSAGRYKIQLQAVVFGGLSFRLDDWTLVASRLV